MPRSYSKTVQIRASGARLLAILAVAAVLISGAVVARAALDGSDSPTAQAPAAVQATPPAATPEAEIPVPESPVVATPEGADAVVGTPATEPEVAQAAEEITPTAQESPGIAVVDTVVVDADGLNVRTEPGLQGDVAVVVPRGLRATVVGGPTAADGYTWYRLEADGVAGWVAGEFLTPAQSGAASAETE